LQAHELNGTSGGITWPSVLRDTAYAAARGRIDDLMAQRTHQVSDPQSEINREVRELTQQMRTTLKSQISEVDPADYLAARKFLVSLAHETRQPVPIQGLASR
jgi:hypothetical protein